jgi:Tfp pilus assembly protein PilN
VAAVAVGGLYLHARSGISSAQTEVNTAQAQNSTLTTKLNGLASVKQTFANVQAKQALLQQAMGQEIRWSYVLNDLSLRIPSNIWLTAMQANEVVPGIGTNTASTATALPGAPASDIGTIAFSGYGFKHDDVATWLDAVAKERGFSQPIFTGSTETAINGTGVVNFGSSVTVNSKALSGRYIQKAGS